MKTTIAGLSLIVAAVFGVVAAVPAPAFAAARTATVTLECHSFCTAGWAWYQGGKVLGSGSLGDLPTTVTTAQPATADAVFIILRTGGAKGCSASQGDSFSPGSPINVSVKINSQANAYHDGCHASFSMKS